MVYRSFSLYLIEQKSETPARMPSVKTKGDVWQTILCLNAENLSFHENRLNRGKVIERVVL